VDAKVVVIEVNKDISSEIAPRSWKVNQVDDKVVVIEVNKKYFPR
jgi:hypothetical protein